MIVAPNISNFTKSFKQIGYNHYSSVLDLIDNSISAEATKVWIDYVKNPSNGIDLYITDNGYGMSKNEMIEAMRIASSNPNDLRREDDLGKFGLGMKLASFSQTDVLTVSSKKKGSDCLNSFTWNLEHVRSQNAWDLIENLTKKHFDQHQQTCGTEVILKNIFDSSKTDHLVDIQTKLLTQVALVYSEYNNLNFYINSNKIDLVNPFFKNNLASNLGSKVTHKIGEIKFEVQPFQIPHENKLSSEEKTLLKRMKDIEMGSGLYIYRKNRLIAWSGWEGLSRNLRINDLYRIAVYCDDTADDLFNIEVKKSQISISNIKLKNILKNSIKEYAETARRPYKGRAELSLKDLSDIWSLEKNKDGKVLFKINKGSGAFDEYKINNPNLSELIDSIESTIPYESFLYYLNINKLDYPSINRKKIIQAKKMFAANLISEDELKQLKKRYEQN